MWTVEKPFGVIEVEIVKYEDDPDICERKEKLACLKLTAKFNDGTEAVEYADGYYYNEKYGWYASISYSTKILPKLKGKADTVKIVIDPDDDFGREIKEALEKAKKEMKAKLDKEFHEALRNLKEFYIGIGGDTLDLYVSLPGLYDLAYLSGNMETYKKFEERLKDAIELVIRESKTKEEWMTKLGVEKTDIRTALYNILYDDGTWGKVRMDNPALQEALKKIAEREKKVMEKRALERKAFEEKVKKAIEEAKRTGKEVFIEKIGGYDGDDPAEVRFHGTPEIIREFEEGEGLGWVDIYLVATPEGKVIEKHVPNY
jgi:hypothetical protein